MKTQKDNRKSALAQIHIAKKQLKLDDDIYRDTLQQISGKRSCGDMHISELYKVLSHFEKCGFKRKAPTTRRAKKQYSPKASGQIIDVMRAVWIEMYHQGIIEDGSEMALTKWAERQSSQLNGGVGIAELEWLERTKLASPVLESLKQWHKRVWAKWWREDIRTVNQLVTSESLNPAVAIKQLLDKQHIMYHGKFYEYGVEDAPTYCKTRKELKHD